MSYHLAGLGAALTTPGVRIMQNGRLVTSYRRGAPTTPVFHGRRWVGVAGYGGAGGLGNDSQKARLKLSKAITLNELTSSEVANVIRVFDKYDKDFAALTGGKHPKTFAQAIAILGPYPEIEKIVGHALAPLAPPTSVPGTSPPPPDESSGPPWGLIAAGAAVLAVGYAVTRRPG